MREIKFRARRTDKDEFAFGDLLTGMGYKKGKFFILPHLSYYPSDCKSVDGYEVVPETIGQFTGLYDKNGKEIYEGDILAFDKSYTDFKDVIEVRFVRGVFVFLWNGNLEDECPINAPTREWANVIGNIHDNPELIKTK